jgi:hypothetical protein
MTRKLSRQEKWRAKNPQAVWAHAATRSAIRRGLVVKQPCEVCGAPDTDAHHDDYDRPLMVRWLCRLHHGRAHAEARR